MNLLYYVSRFIKKLNLSSIKNSTIHKTSKIESGSQIVNTSFDKYSFCGYNCTILNAKIGSFCSISNHVIIGGGMHPIDWVSTSPVFYEGRDSIKMKFAEHQRDPQKTTVIGHDVWIGENVLVKQGVNIGDGSIIGMGSVVTKDVEPYSIVAGNPAKEVRKRFTIEIINQLIDIQFWNLDEQVLKKHSIFINDPQKFISEVKK